MTDLELLLHECGLADLTADTGHPVIAARARAFVARLNGADPLERETARRMLVDRLRAVDVDGPVRFVEAAFATAAAPPDDALQGQAVLLQDPEPWPEPVEGTALLNELESTFARFAALAPGAATALPLWTLHAHAHAAPQVSPILGVVSPEKECGKTTVLTLLLALAPRALLASNISTSGVFRTVEKYRPTLLVDEADTFLRDNEELRGIFNSGHFRAGAHIVRNVGDDFEPRVFSTWCAKAIALIGELPDTLTSRSIAIRMHRATAEEQAGLERLRLDRLSELEPLRRRGWRWARANADELQRADPATPAGLRARAADNWRSLLAIADLAGGQWPERARQAAVLLSDARAEDDQSAGELLLADLRDLFHDRGTDRLASAEIVGALGEREDRPWSEWRKGKPLTVRQLARLVGRFGVTPGTIRTPLGTPKGYYLEQFEDLFRRYPAPSATPPQSTNGGAFPAKAIRHRPPNVADATTETVASGGQCGGVADREGGLGRSPPDLEAHEERAAIRDDGADGPPPALVREWAEAPLDEPAGDDGEPPEGDPLPEDAPVATLVSGDSAGTAAASEAALVKALDLEPLDDDAARALAAAPRWPPTVIWLPDGTYRVPDGSASYVVAPDSSNCECPDFRRLPGPCRHMQAVREWCRGRKWRRADPGQDETARAQGEGEA